MVEEEINQGIEGNPQDLSESTGDDLSSLLSEAQEDIQPQNHPSQEKESYCSIIQRKIKTPPPLTEEEINQMINTQPASKSSCEQNIYVPPPTNAIYHKS